MVYAESIRMSMDRAIQQKLSIQCNCKNKHSFRFLPISEHPILGLKVVYGLLLNCDVPVTTDDGWNEFVYDDEWFYQYHELRIDHAAELISIAKINEGEIEALLEFPLKDVKDIISLKMSEDFDWDCESIRKIKEVYKHG